MERADGHGGGRGGAGGQARRSRPAEVLRRGELGPEAAGQKGRRRGRAQPAGQRAGQIGHVYGGRARAQSGGGCERWQARVRELDGREGERTEERVRTQGRNQSWQVGGTQARP